MDLCKLSARRLDFKVKLLWFNFKLCATPIRDTIEGV